MAPQKENPAHAARGVPATDQADGSVTPEFRSPLIHKQVARLTRLYGVNAAMAEALAPLVFLEALR